MTDERPRRSRRVAAPRNDGGGPVAPPSTGSGDTPAPRPAPATDGGVTIRRVGSDGTLLGTTAPGAATPPASKPASTPASKPAPAPAPTAKSAPKAAERSTPSPKPTPAPKPARARTPKPVAAPKPAPRPDTSVAGRARTEALELSPAAPVRTVTAAADTDPGSSPVATTGAPEVVATGTPPVVATGTPEVVAGKPAQLDAPLGKVAGDAPLETKPTAKPQRSAKHELVDDARRQRRTARKRRTKRHPGRGVFGGVLVGAGVAAMLVLYGFLPLGEATLAVPVAVFAVVGFLIGTRGPTRGRRPATATMHVPDSPTLTGITPITPLTTTSTADPDAHRMSGSEDLGTVFGPTGHDDDDV